MLITISSLPKEIQKQIPLSIKVFKDTYELSELPPKIQYLIKNYINNVPDTQYNLLFDFSPEFSDFGDFRTINSVVDLVIEYIKNYLIIIPGAYPFDPSFGCTLKYHLQTRDTETRKTLIAAEVSRVVDVIKSVVSAQIYVESVDIKPVSSGFSTEFDIEIHLVVNDTHKKVSIHFKND